MPWTSNLEPSESIAKLDNSCREKRQAIGHQING